MILDDDKIYFINSQWLKENVRCEQDLSPVAFAILPTDDPNKFIYRITQPMPRFYIKSVRAHEWDKL